MYPVTEFSHFLPLSNEALHYRFGRRNTLLVSATEIGKKSYYYSLSCCWPSYVAVLIKPWLHWLKQLAVMMHWDKQTKTGHPDSLHWTFESFILLHGTSPCALRWSFCQLFMLKFVSVAWVVRLFEGPMTAKLFSDFIFTVIVLRAW